MMQTLYLQLSNCYNNFNSARTKHDVAENMYYSIRQQQSIESTENLEKSNQAYDNAVILLDAAERKFMDLKKQFKQNIQQAIENNWTVVNVNLNLIPSSKISIFSEYIYWNSVVIKSVDEWLHNNCNDEYLFTYEDKLSPSLSDYIIDFIFKDRNDAIMFKLSDKYQELNK